MAHESAAAPVHPVIVTQQNCVAACGISPRKWREWIPGSGIPFVRVGSQIAVNASDLAAWVRQNADVMPTAEAGSDAEAVRRRCGIRAVGGGR